MPHTFTTSEVVTAAELNPCTQILQIGTTKFGGTAPSPTGTPFLWQAWAGSLTTDGSGNGNVVFPTSFPNGQVVTIVNIDFGGGIRAWILETGANASVAGIGCTLVTWNTGTPAVAVGVANTFVSYMAFSLGW